MDTFAFLKSLAVLVMPPASLAVGALLALLLLAFRWRRLALIVLVLAVAQVVILSFQPVGDALMSSLERQVARGRGGGAGLLLRRHRRAGRRHWRGASARAAGARSQRGR